MNRKMKLTFTFLIVYVISLLLAGSSSASSFLFALSRRTPNETLKQIVYSKELYNSKNLLTYVLSVELLELANSFPQP